jgi:uncharacterized protein (TIGR00297 family)
VTVRNEDKRLGWQSKAVLLLVLPWTAANVVLQSHWWFTQVPSVAWTTLGISAIFGLIVWKMRAGTAGAALTGSLITASLMFSTTKYPYEYSWLHGGLMPLLAVFLLTWGATRIGLAKKERLGTAESKRGRNAAQVAANLGVAALASFPFQAITPDKNLASLLGTVTAFAALASLAEAAADTVSSEIGQVLGGRPRLISTLRSVEPGTDGGITLAGTSFGILAAFLVSAVGLGVARGDLGDSFFWILTLAVTFSGTFGLLFDSVLGATLENKGWLNNDSVNFLSTASAAAFAVGGIWWLASQIRV